jgi:glyoxylate/hydroxypyruvate reductase A
MTEYIVLHVLMHHRQQRRIDENQKQRKWDSFPTHAAPALSVGIMGLGVMGQDSAQKLRMLGFRVAGWSRTRKEIPGVDCYAGVAEFATIRKLSRQGPFGAPYLINAGRGRQQVAEDILAALDAGELYGATLDVFKPEPLAAESPFWTHPKVTVTPHLAADSDPETISAYVARQIERHEQGLPLDNLVDKARGY